jgi:hypothetical protein
VRNDSYVSNQLFSAHQLLYFKDLFKPRHT